MACVFCAIVAAAAGEAVAPEHMPEVVARWDDAIAFVPLNPVVPGHTLVVPVSHVQDFTCDPRITGATSERASELVRRLDDAEGWNLITSAGSAATQTVRHLHTHLVPRYRDDGLPLPWTPQQA